VTETCDHDTPNLITNVETTPATEQDNMVLVQVHTALEEKELLPAQHLVDAGYPSAKLLAKSQKDFGVYPLGSVRPDVRWQVHDEQSFDIT
jgi:transposase